MVFSRKNVAMAVLGCVTAIHLAAYLSVKNDEPPSPLPAGSRFPPAIIRTLDDRAISADSIVAGKCVVAWISIRCPACREEIRSLDRLSKDHADTLALCVISLDPCTETNAFRDEFSVSLPMYVLDRSAAKDVYHVKRVPTLFFIGRQKEIVTILPSDSIPGNIALTIGEFLDKK